MALPTSCEIALGNKRLSVGKPLWGYLAMHASLEKGLQVPILPKYCFYSLYLCLLRLPRCFRKSDVRLGAVVHTLNSTTQEKEAGRMWDVLLRMCCFYRIMDKAVLAR